MHRFRWKRLDVLFTIAVSLWADSGHSERNGWPIITKIGSHRLAEEQKLDQQTFQVADSGGLT